MHTHKERRRTFYLRLTVDGRRRRLRLGTDHEGWSMGKAMVALEEHLDAVRAGTWTLPDQPAATPEEDPTFRAVASSWLEDNMLEWRIARSRTCAGDWESHLLPHVGEQRLSRLDIPRVTAVKTALLKESRRIAERIDAGEVQRDANNVPLRPLSNDSIKQVPGAPGPDPR